MMNSRIQKSFLRISTIALSALALLTGTHAMAQSAACNTDVANHMPEFHDVSQSHYAAKALKALYDKGIANGTSDHYFCATDEITRIDAAVFIYRLKFESKVDNSKTLPFTDTSSLQGEKLEAVQTLYSRAVIDGSSNQFRPNEKLYRSEAASMLAKAYITLSEMNKLSDYDCLFSDVTANAWYYTVVQAVSHQCIMSGTGNNNFTPGATINRINFAYALAHAHELVPRCDDDLVCAVKLGKCAACNPDDYKPTCSPDNSYVQKCSDDGTLAKDKDCPNGCKDGECKECTDNVAKCDGDTLKTCENGKWKDSKCATNQICDTDKCVDKDTSTCNPACKDGETCVNGKCESDAPECTGTEAKCDGDTLKTCINGKWQDSKCATNQICDTDKCVDKDTSICEPACKAGEICVNGKCESDNKCEENTYQCDANKIRQKCKGGVWVNEPCSEGLICENNDCIMAPSTSDCTDNAKECAGNTTLRKCEHGSWVTIPCGEKQICENNDCVDKPADPTPGECKENAVKCTGKGGRQICEGGKWVDKDCANGLTCKNNDCVPVSECTDNAEECDENGIHRICKNGKWENDPCGSGQVCKDGTCESVPAPSEGDDCSQGNGNAPVPLAVLLMLAGAGLLIRRRRHSA